MVSNRLAQIQPRQPIVGAQQPGTLQQQLSAILLYHSDQDKVGVNDSAAWSRARRRTMPHVRAAEDRD